MEEKKKTEKRKGRDTGIEKENEKGLQKKESKRKKERRRK